MSDSLYYTLHSTLMIEEDLVFISKDIHIVIERVTNATIILLSQNKLLLVI